MNELIYHENKGLLQGPAGKLEVICEAAEQTTNNITAIISHPHPLYGGTMHNKVVTTLAKTYKDLGIKRVIRFNFRGIGQSEGGYAEGVGEQADLTAIIEWSLQDTDNIWLAGFSFGAYIAVSAAHLAQCRHLTCIAPAVSRFDFTKLPEFCCPWIVVQGEQDEVIEPEQVFQWLSTLNHPPTLIRMPQATHFFHGLLLELRSQLTQALSKYL